MFTIRTAARTAGVAAVQCLRCPEGLCHHSDVPDQQQRQGAIISSAIKEIRNYSACSKPLDPILITDCWGVGPGTEESAQSQADSRAIRTSPENKASLSVSLTALALTSWRRNKRIALELILGVLSNAGPVFRQPLYGGRGRKWRDHTRQSSKCGAPADSWKSCGGLCKVIQAFR